MHFEISSHIIHEKLLQKHFVTGAGLEIKKGNEDDQLETLHTEQITEYSIFEDSKNVEKELDKTVSLNRLDTDRSGDIPETEDYVPI